MSNVFGSDGGDYLVVVSNAFGGRTSTVARLTVVGDPIISVQPAGQRSEVGQSASFSVNAIGTAPFNYQWWHDGLVLPGATNATLVLTNLQAPDPGNYTVVVGNQYGSVTSAVALLTVNFVTLDSGFNPRANGSVLSLAMQADGKILVGGGFTTLGGQPRTNIARLNADGTLDSGFIPGANGSVYTLSVQGDGKILVGGYFTTLGGQPRSRIGRLNADGTLDSGFNPAAGRSDGNTPYVYSLAVQADGKILVGGYFTTLGGQPRYYLGRLNADGTLDNGFNAGAGAGYYRVEIYSLAVQADGKILVGGAFTSLGGQTRNSLGRLNADGTMDNGFNPGVNGYVYSLAVQAEGKILVGGKFTALGGQPRQHLARLNADGTLDYGFRAGTGGVFDPYVRSLAVQADGKILVGGGFTTLGEQSRNYLGRLNADGTLDSEFNTGASGPVYSLAVQGDGRILVGGYFTTLGGQPRTFLGRLNNAEPATHSLSYDGSNVTWLRGGSGPEVWRTSFDYSSDGLSWTNLGTGTRIPGGWTLGGVSLPAAATLRARGFVADGYGNASGWFAEDYWGPLVWISQPASRTNNAGETARFFAVAGGSAPLTYQWFKGDLPLGDGGPVSGVGTATLTLSNVLRADEGDYQVVVSHALGSHTSAVARLTVADPFISIHPASQLREVGESASFSVGAFGTALSYQWWHDGLKVAGATNATVVLTNLQAPDPGNYNVVVSNQYGSVTSAVALLTVNLATLDSGFNPGAKGSVYSLAVQADGKILVGGYFTTLSGQPRANIARLNVDGTLDSGFNPGANGSVNSLAVQADGKILAGGGFTGFTTLGQPRLRIARLNAEGTLDSMFNPGANGSVSSLAVQADGKILVGGSFTTLGGQPRLNIARLNAEGTLDSGFNPGPNGSVNSLAVQTDGKILVGGYFTTLGGQSRTNIARLNAEGTLDGGFNPTVGLSAAYGYSPNVNSLAVQADGKILVGGTFTTLGGQPRTNIARLNADGTLDGRFNPGANSTVTSLAVQAGGKILVGGNFGTLGGQPRNYFGRLNNTEPATQSLSYDGSTVSWQRGGTSPEVWRTGFDYSTDGVSWTNLGAGTRVPGGWALGSVSLSAEATLRARGFVTGRDNASGWFTEDYRGPLVWISQPDSLTNNAVETARFFALAGGSAPLNYQWFKDDLPLTDGGPVAGAATATLTMNSVFGPDGGDYRVVVSNAFGGRTSAVARLTVVGDPFISIHPASQLREVGQSASFNVSAVGTAALSFQWWHDGLKVAGATNATLVLTNLQAPDPGNYNVVVSNQYGSVTSAVALLTVNLATLDSGFNPGENWGVNSLAVQADGKILVGGGFTGFTTGQPRTNIARLNADGMPDSEFNPGAGASGWPSVNSLMAQADGKILVGGLFTTLGGQPRTNIAKLNADGTLDIGFNPGASGSVSSLAMQSDGKILVGGLFTTLGGQPRTNIARLNADGMLDSGFNPGANGLVSSLAVQANEKILVGGSFTTLSGQPRTNIARLNADGMLDSGFNPGANGLVSSLTVQADEKILVGGSFTTLGGQPRTNIARLNADGTLDSGFNPGAGGVTYPTVYSLAVQADGKILAGGSFTTLGGQPRTNIARLNANGTLDNGFYPGVNWDVYSLAVQADGKILVGSLGLRRLNNSEPATQNLSYDGSIVTWLRGGTSPEVSRTAFDYTTNGVNWNALDTGVRIAGGWQLTNVLLPAGSTIRARGWVTGGYRNGSSWFVETLLPLSPRLLVNDSHFGFTDGQFGFNFQALPGDIVVVEGSTNLLNWFPLQTNAYSNGPVFFRDPVSTNGPQQFYRAKLLP